MHLLSEVLGNDMTNRINRNLQEVHRMVDALHKTDINIPNEPFQMFRKLFRPMTAQAGHTNCSVLILKASRICVSRMKSMIMTP